MTHLGCATLRDRGPVDEDTAYARQLTQQGADEILKSNWSQAEQRFQEAVRCCPDHCDARVKLAECLWRRGESALAIHELSEAIRLSGGHDATMIVLLGEMYFQSGPVDQAAELARHALDRDPKNVRALTLRGVIQQRSGDLSNALASFHRALSYSPNDADVRLAMAELYFQLDRPRRTLASLDRLEGVPLARERAVRAKHLRGLALRDVGRYHESVDALLAAHSQCEVPSSHLLTDLAESQMKAEHYSDARLTLDLAQRHSRTEQQSTIDSLRHEIAKRADDGHHLRR